MKWFDSDYDYIDEFTTQWNERYKKIKRIGIILSVVLILIGILCFAFSRKSIHNDSNYCSYWIDCLGCL